MPILTKQDVDNDLNDPIFQEAMNMSPEERTRTIAQLQAMKSKMSVNGRIGSGVQGFLGDVSDVFLQRGGIKLPERKTDINNLITREYVKKAFKSQEKERAPTEYTGTTVPEGYEVGVDKLGRRILEKKKEIKKSFNETMNEDIGKAMRGEEDWADIKAKYPLHIEKINKLKMQTTPVSANPQFKRGTGGLISKVRSYLNPNQAEISATTQKVISNIKTEADMKEFMDKMDKYAAAGVDTKAILEYFGVQ